METLTLPGLIDCHVHLREPGLTQKGDMETETRAALAGGVTTVCDMPNTVPPTVTVAAFAEKVKRAERIEDCDIRLFFGVTAREHLAELKTLTGGGGNPDLRRRLAGVKLFLDHSTGNQGVDPSIAEDVLRFCVGEGLTVTAHCEDPLLNAEAAKSVTSKDVSAHSRMRPPESEAKAIAFLLDLARVTGAHVHVAHLSTKLGVELVRQAKADGIAVTCEATSHHLFLTTDDYAALGTFAKMNPPLRSKADQQALWEAIADGTIDCIATDHAPHTVAEKQTGDPLRAPSGVPGVETMLPLLLTVAAGKWPGKQLRHSAFDIQHSDIVRLCFTNPNRIFGLGKTEANAGRIEIDPQAEWTIRGKELHSKCGWSPYEGWRVAGKIVSRIA